MAVKPGGTPGSTPSMSVSGVVFPTVRGDELTLRGLVRELKTKGPVYRRTVQTALKASCTNHYRRGPVTSGRQSNVTSPSSRQGCPTRQPGERFRSQR
ncbi:hypothetical protein [Nonomuraea sp. NPDC050310]|uniref:hypothetical protein n=1 Tax=Nonomuraea sp. NPDC050310 TaxID=3154935 RepID=UPI0033D93523